MTIAENSLAHEILQIISEVSGARRPLALHEPWFKGNEWQYVKECIDSGWVSSVGAYVPKFEQALEKYTGARFAIATSNGTSALQVCGRLAGVVPNDEVLMPALTFIATANAVSYLGAVPHFVDSEEDSLGVDVVKLRRYLETATEKRAGGCFNRQTGRRIPALIVMHTFGHSVNLEACTQLCHEFGITLIEDAAESLGTYYREAHTGTLGRLGALSFNGNKIVTTGGGGAILTNDPELAQRAKHLTTTAKVPHAWEFVHDDVGYNFRMPNLNAAMGVAQLESLPEFLEKKRELARRYATKFEGARGLRFVKAPSFSKSNYWLNAIVLDDAGLLETVLRKAHEEKIFLRPAWRLLHRLPMYASCPRMSLDTAASLEARLINLPSSPNLIGDYD